MITFIKHNRITWLSMVMMAGLVIVPEWVGAQDFIQQNHTAAAQQPVPVYVNPKQAYQNLNDIAPYGQAAYEKTWKDVAIQGAKIAVVLGLYGGFWWYMTKNRRNGFANTNTNSGGSGSNQNNNNRYHNDYHYDGFTQSSHNKLDEAYKAFDLDKNAHPEDVRRQYRTLSRECHPDKPNGSQEKTQKLNEYRDTIKEDFKRRGIDPEAKKNQ